MSDDAEADDFVHVDVAEVSGPPLLKRKYKRKKPKPLLEPVPEQAGTGERGVPLDKEEWLTFFDGDGRLVNESLLRKSVFRGGIDPTIRPEVWKFLLGYFPFHSTYREREVIAKQKKVEYYALLEHWRAQLNEDDSQLEFAADNLDDQEQFMYIQAKLNAMRRVIDLDKAAADMKIILKDVPRTDRTHEYFSGHENEHLQTLENILMTFAMYNQDVGYAQGMNDVLAMVLVVTDDEAEAFWCFSQWMDIYREDFMSKGMVEKLECLVELLKIMDPELMDHFVAIDGGDVVFCHRWILLCFKREFPFDDSLRLFEILCSHHLELSSMVAEQARDSEIRKEVEKELDRCSSIMLDGSVSKLKGEVVERSPTNPMFTFGIFVSVAILVTYRKDLLACKDVADVFGYINNLVLKMNLDQILVKAESVFFEYCRKSVSSADASYLLLQVDENSPAPAVAEATAPF